MEMEEVECEMTMLSDSGGYDGGDRLRCRWNGLIGGMEEGWIDDNTSSRSPGFRFPCQRGWKSSLETETL